MPIIPVNMRRSTYGGLTTYLARRAWSDTARDISFLHIGYKPLTIARVTRIH